MLEEQRGVETAPLARPGPAEKQHPQRRQRPRQAPQQEHRAEEPPGLLPVGARRQVAREVLVHEEELEKIRQPPRREPVPGHRDGEKQRQPGRGMQPPPGREIARIDAVQDQDGRRNGRRHQPLGQHPEGDGGPGSEHPAARLAAPRSALALRREETPRAPRSCTASGSCRASAADPGRRTTACPASIAAARNPAAPPQSRLAIERDGEHRAQRRERGVQPRREFVVAEQTRATAPSPNTAAAASRCTRGRSGAGSPSRRPPASRAESRRSGPRPD